jgi:multidrug resistance efflux pump
MNERKLSEIQAWQDSLDAQVMRVATGANGPAAEIERAKQLLDKGVINQAEFDMLKANAIAGSNANAAPTYPQYAPATAGVSGYQSVVVETTAVSMSAPEDAKVSQC